MPVIKFRRSTAAEATADNRVLASGEPGFETDTGKFKIGNGSAAWNSLPYAGGPQGDSDSGSSVELVVTDFGAVAGGSATINRAAFEDAEAAAYAAGGGVIVVPPATVPYDIAIKSWSDAGSLNACIRLRSKIRLHIPEGATVKMAANQLTTAGAVILIYGADCGVTGTGVIDGNSLNQSGYTGGYAQNGPNGVFIPPVAQCHRLRIGAGDTGHLTIKNTFGNPINGGGSFTNGIIDDVSIVGLITDNVGEGAQIERANRVEMRRIVSLNTLGNMTGDGAELAGVTNFLVEDIYAENTVGSGFDLFGCQTGTMNRITSINADISIHDFSPVSPCTDVTATNLLVRFNSGGSGERGINLHSQHASLVPKNIRVQGRVINMADLQTGVYITQIIDVATYGGGPYGIDVDVEGCDVGYDVTKAPRLHARGVVRNCGIGFNLEGPDADGTDRLGWDVSLWMFDNTTDYRFNGANDANSPSGVLGGYFTTVEGAIYRLLLAGDKVPRSLTTGADNIGSAGYAVVHHAGGLAARISVAAPDSELILIFDASGTLGHAYPATTNSRGILLKDGDGVGSTVAYAAGAVVRLVYDAVVEKWREL